MKSNPTTNAAASEKKRRRPLRWLLGAFVAYLVVMLLIVPPIAKSIAQKKLSEELSRTVSIGRITVNPLTFSLTIRKLDIRDPDGGAFVSWETVHANPRVFALLRGNLYLDSVRLSSLNARAVRRADGSFNFTDLIEKYTADKDKPAPDVRVGIIKLENCAVDFEDESLARPVRVALDEIAVTMREVTTAAGAMIPLEFAMRWNRRGSLRGDGTFSISPPVADLNLSLANVELKPIDPFLDQFAKVLITKGAFSMNGRAKVSIPKDAPMQASFEGDALLEQFATTDGLVGEDLLRWDNLQLSRMKLQLAPMRVEIAEITFAKFYSRFVIGEEMDTNIGNVLGVDLLGAVTPKANPPAKKKQSTPPADAPEEKPDTKPFEMPLIKVGVIKLSNGTFSFADRSVQPNVFLTLARIQGDIANLSSDELQRADVHLTALANNTSHVEIKGTVNPLTHEKPTDLVITCREVDLVPTSPYSGKFLGYTLAKGKLTVDLKYEIAQRKLKAHNLITIDQLTLGERTNSPDATKLPVKLGIAVLKDRDGKMVLDVPVQGSLDDPEFGYSRVVWRAINVVFTKILTSPFSILGAMFGGGEADLSYLEFEAGSAALPQDTKKLDVLVKALSERPALQLEIEGATDAKADADALRKRKLELQLQTMKFKAQRQKGPADAPENLTLTPEEHEKFLRAAYAEALPKLQATLAETKPTDPEVSPAATTTPTRPFTNIRNLQPRGAPREAPAAQPADGNAPVTLPAKTAPVEEIERVLLRAVEITDDDLRELAGERQRVVDEFIRQSGKVESSRVFLLQSNPDTTPRVGSRVYFNLK